MCSNHGLILSRLGIISLGGGLPSSEYFPFEHIDIKVPTPPGFTPEETKESGTILHAGKHDIKEGKSLYGEWKTSVGSKRIQYVLLVLSWVL